MTESSAHRWLAPATEKLKMQTEYRLKLKGGPGGNCWIEMARKGAEKEGKGAEEGERDERGTAQRFLSANVSADVNIYEALQLMLSG